MAMAMYMHAGYSRQRRSTLSRRPSATTGFVAMGARRLGDSVFDRLFQNDASVRFVKVDSTLLRSPIVRGREATSKQLRVT